MARDKEKAANPAATYRKAEKQKAVKKGRAAVTAQRTERLAHRNPYRLQSQIDDLKSRESNEGCLSTRDKKTLETLEKEVHRVYKAKELVSKKTLENDQRHSQEKQSQTRSRENSNAILGKRSREQSKGKESNDSETDDDVKGIPMPRDTPPLLPTKGHRSRWQDVSMSTGNLTSCNGLENWANFADQVPSRTIYEAKPVVRNLRKEATNFLPSAVRRKVEQSKAEVPGKYLEPEEMDALEKQGYGNKNTIRASHVPRQSRMTSGVVSQPDGNWDGSGQIEEVEDEGA